MNFKLYRSTLFEALFGGVKTHCKVTAKKNSNVLEEVINQCVTYSSGGILCVLFILGFYLN